MAGGTGTRRVLLPFAVLAGLFLMHGLSAPAMHGMPMPAPMSTQVSMPAHLPSQANAPTAVSNADAMPDSMQAGMTCIPLRPEGMAGLFLALFLLVITQWRPRLSLPPRPIRSHWPHGPPRTGAQILRALSISRT